MDMTRGLSRDIGTPLRKILAKTLLILEVEFGSQEIAKCIKQFVNNLMFLAYEYPKKRAKERSVTWTGSHRFEHG
jgi:hypothetical protein